MAGQGESYLQTLVDKVCIITFLYRQMLLQQLF